MTDPEPLIQWGAVLTPKGAKYFEDLEQENERLKKENDDVLYALGLTHDDSYADHRLVLIERDRLCAELVETRADRARAKLRADRLEYENERLREALGRVQGLARTDGPAAPLLIRCDVEATVALTFSIGK